MSDGTQVSDLNFELDFAGSRLNMVGISGLPENTVEELGLPDIQTYEDQRGRQVPFAVYGDLGAPNLVFSATTYSTSIEDKSQQIRMSAGQAVLGERYCVVGTTPYSPKTLGLTLPERKIVANGSFLPFADRMLGVIDTIAPKDDQKVILYGFSFGGDVAVELTHATLYDEQRGVVGIENLGVFDPARVANRGGLAVSNAFRTSGAELYYNVITSNSLALLEARNIDTYDPNAEKKHQKEVERGVAMYSLRDPLGNLAIIRGFGCDETLVQLDKVSRHANSPNTFLGRMSDSSVFPENDFEAFAGDVTKLLLKGDHSAADNLIFNSALMLLTTQGLQST